MNDIDKTLQDLDKLSQSQIDRIISQNEMYTSLIQFLHNRIDSIKEGDDIETLARKRLKEQLEDKEVTIPRRDLIDIIKMMKDDKNMGTNSILSVLKENVKVVIDNSNIDPDNPTNRKKSESRLNADEVDDLKGLAKLVKNLEKEGKSAEEIEIDAIIE